DEKAPGAAEVRPADDAERELNEKVEYRVSLKVHFEERAPRHGQQRDVGVVVDDVQQNVGENTEGDGGVEVGAPDRCPESPGNRCENDPGGDGVGGGKE